MKMKNIGTLLKTMLFFLLVVVCQKGIAQENTSDTLRVNLEKALEIALSDNPTDRKSTRLNSSH